jgi:hypothetical protein
MKLRVYVLAAVAVLVNRACVMAGDLVALGNNIERSNLPGSGAPKMTFDGGTFWTGGDVVARLAPALVEQRASMYGRVTKTRGGRRIDIDVPLFSLWQNLPKLFPATVMNPAIGSRIFGVVDLPLAFHARNGDLLTIHNARVTGLSNLRLASNQPIFSSAVRFTGLLRNGYDPIEADAYFSFATGQAYVDSGFAMTNFKAGAWTGAWGARPGFDAINTEAGWGIDWEMSMDEDPVDGLGAVDMFLSNFWARVSSIPVGPSGAQLASGVNFQGAGAEIGSGIHEDVDDLVLTNGAASVTLKAAALVETGYVFAPSKKRTGETVWEPTRGFLAGVPGAIAAVA